MNWIGITFQALYQKCFYIGSKQVVMDRIMQFYRALDKAARAQWKWNVLFIETPFFCENRAHFWHCKYDAFLEKIS